MGAFRLNNIRDCSILWTFFGIVVSSAIGAVNARAFSSAISFPDERSCPKGEWFYNGTSKCYPSEKQGPCPDSMMFYPYDKMYGDCDCPRPNVSHSSSPVWVYDLASDRCFQTYQQGFCSDGEWLVIKDNTTVACEPNPCEWLQRHKPELNKIHPVVVYNKTCVRLSLPNRYAADAGCMAPYEITIDQYAGTVFCTSDLQSYNLGVKKRFQCRPGTKRDRLGNCRQIHQVTFKP